MNNEIELYSEPYRPQFHFTAKAGWLNDPNGLVYYAGEYHLFYQHNPTDINWGNMHWGHAISKDLIHWEELPIALAPNELGAIFSGSAVVDWNNTTGFQVGDEPPIVAIYTAAGGETPESAGQPYTQCLAYSNDRGRTWKNYAANPVLPHVVGQNRDPKVGWYAPKACWVMSLFLDGEDYALFMSTNLKHWHRIQTLHLPGASECPDLYPLPVEREGDKRYWIFSGANGIHIVGDFDGRFFSQIEEPRRIDYGANYYAVQTFSDIDESDGRRIEIAWMAGGTYPDMPFNQQMSIPCELTLRRTAAGLRLYRYPVDEIESLRRASFIKENILLNSEDNPLSGIDGDLFDLTIEVADQQHGQLLLKVREQEIEYSYDDRKLTCLGRSVSLQPVNGAINLRILVDRASLEIFANDGEVTMTFCFNAEPSDHPLQLLAKDSSIKVNRLELYELRSAWK